VVSHFQKYNLEILTDSEEKQKLLLQRKEPTQDSSCIAEIKLIYLSNIESSMGDRGKLARASGKFATIVHHSEDGKKTVLRLPSCKKKIVLSRCRGQVGVDAGGGRIEKPMLKAGRVHHKAKTKRHNWPRVWGVALNPVDHPHGGGNHQYIILRLLVEKKLNK